MSVWIVWDTKYRHIIAVYLSSKHAEAYLARNPDRGWEVFPQIVVDG
jgi:hypothetical protein